MHSFRTLRRWAGAAAVIGTLALVAPAGAVTDCSIPGKCLDASRLPKTKSVDWGDLIRRAQRFYGVSTPIFIVSSSDVEARLPYFLPEQRPLIYASQIHIPEIYHAITEVKHRQTKHYIWQYIVGHEMAHANQHRLKLIDAMVAPSQSVVLAELHADFMAGFFLAREYGLSVAAIDQLQQELTDLPAGAPGSPSFHGSPRQRFFMVTQGALLALKRPTPSLGQASSEGIRRAFDLMPQIGAASN
ncbi:MAG: hypothetical protein AAFW46_03445 [Pseudomonadota bacterium]